MRVRFSFTTCSAVCRRAHAPPDQRAPQHGGMWHSGSCGQFSPRPGTSDQPQVWACAQVVDGLFMWLLSGPLGVVRIRWGFAAEADVDAAAVVEVFDPGATPV